MNNTVIKAIKILQTYTCDMISHCSIIIINYTNHAIIWFKLSKNKMISDNEAVEQNIDLQRHICNVENVFRYWNDLGTKGEEDSYFHNSHICPPNLILVIISVS